MKPPGNPATHVREIHKIRQVKSLHDSSPPTSDGINQVHTLKSLDVRLVTVSTKQIVSTRAITTRELSFKT